MEQKNILSLCLWPAAAVLLYLALQTVCSVIAVLVTSFSGNVLNVASWGLSLSLLISAAVTSTLLLTIRQWGLRNAYSSVGCSTPMAVVGVAACLCCLFAFNLFCEFIPLPDLMADTFTGMASTWIGVLALGVAGPVCEELVCRGGIMEPLLRKGVNGWIAVVVSALVFGLLHGNPAQIPFACLVGIVFGIIYWRTRSLFITTLCHIVNNLVSVWLMRQYGEHSAEMTFRQLWGDWACWGILVGSLVAGGILLWLFWRKVPLQQRTGD